MIEIIDTFLIPAVELARYLLAFWIVVLLIQSAFDWRKVKNLVLYLIVLAGGLEFYKVISFEGFDLGIATECKVFTVDEGSGSISTQIYFPERKYEPEVFECGGWLVTSPALASAAYNSIEWASSTTISVGIATVITGVFLIVIWLELLKGLTFGLKSLAYGFGIGICTFFIFSNIPFIFAMTNKVVESFVSETMLGTSSVTSDIAYLKSKILNAIEILYLASENSWFPLEKYIGILGFKSTLLMLDAISLMNLGLFLLQYLIVIFIPLALGFSVILGTYDIRQVFRFCIYASGIRLFSLVQMGIFRLSGFTDQDIAVSMAGGGNNIAIAIAIAGLSLGVALILIFQASTLLGVVLNNEFGTIKQR